VGVALLAGGAPAPAVPAPAPGFVEASARAHAQGPPPGHTGGFDEPTCHACHADFALDVGGTLTLEGLPGSYRAGHTYVVTVVLRSTEMERAGFQAAVRYAGGEHRGAQAGRVRPVDGRTAVVSSGGHPELLYVQHVAAGTEVGDPELATWSFEWTAPTDRPDPVVFHAAGNSANGDDSPLGDLIYATRLEIAGPGRSSR
jgi:hypothetical protein